MNLREGEDWGKERFPVRKRRDNARIAIVCI